jgi:Cu/Ag efflux pump CusA
MLFLFFPAYYSGFISFRINGKRNRKLELILTLTIFSSLIIFFLLGFLLDLWHPAWLVFLSIPVVSMIASAKFFNKKLPFVAVTPFIALVGFFLAGEILDGYHWSWLFFLMIPMAGILNDR